MLAPTCHLNGIYRVKVTPWLWVWSQFRSLELSGATDATPLTLSSLVPALHTGEASGRHTQSACCGGLGVVARPCVPHMPSGPHMAGPNAGATSASELCVAGGVWSVVAAVGSVVSFPTEENARLGAAGRACT